MDKISNYTSRTVSMFDFADKILNIKELPKNRVEVIYEKNGAAYKANVSAQHNLKLVKLLNK